jgi:hypothetical protein
VRRWASSHQVQNEGTSLTAKITAAVLALAAIPLIGAAMEDAERPFAPRDGRPSRA